MSNDRCANCIHRGDLRACTSGPCSVRDSWYCEELRDILNEIYHKGHALTIPTEIIIRSMIALERN